MNERNLEQYPIQTAFLFGGDITNPNFSQEIKMDIPPQYANKDAQTILRTLCYVQKISPNLFFNHIQIMPAIAEYSSITTEYLKKFGTPYKPMLPDQKSCGKEYSVLNLFSKNEDLDVAIGQWAWEQLPTYNEFKQDRGIVWNLTVSYEGKDLVFSRLSELFLTTPFPDCDVKVEIKTSSFAPKDCIEQYIYIRKKPEFQTEDDHIKKDIVKRPGSKGEIRRQKSAKICKEGDLLYIIATRANLPLSSISQF